MKHKKHSVEHFVHQTRRGLEQATPDHTLNSTDQPPESVFQSDSRLVSLRHHPALWLAPAALLILAIAPWPYGFYNLLRLSVCVVSTWLAYEQWKHDNAVSGWVVALGATALLYNPLIPIHLTREIWIVLNLATAGVFLGHLWALKKLLNSQTLDLQSTGEFVSRSSSRTVQRGKSRSP